MQLPANQYATGMQHKLLNRFGGLNRTNAFSDGEFREMCGLTTARYPYLSTWDGMQKVEDLPFGDNLFAWDDLIYTKNGKLYIGDTEVCSVAAGKKQFAVVNTALVVWPDKIVVSLTDKSCREMDVSISGSGAFTTNFKLKITPPDGKTLRELFTVGDRLTITGATGDLAANNRARWKLTDIHDDTQELEFEGTEQNPPFPALGSAAAITVAREIPDMDYICAHNNRIFGCSSSEKLIFASALGDPMNWFDYDGLSTDAAYLPVASAGDFTGMISYGSVLMLFKEDEMLRLYGDQPSEYGYFRYVVKGVQAGCADSLQVVNNALYYKGRLGIYEYTGSTPQLISYPLGDTVYTGCDCACVDNRFYWLAMTRADGRKELLRYDTLLELWSSLDYTGAEDMVYFSGDTYLLRGGVLYRTDTAGEAVAYTAELCAFDEGTMNRKDYCHLLLRLTVEGTCSLQIREEDGTWIERKRIDACERDVISIPLQPMRKDRISVRFVGTGKLEVEEMQREYIYRNEVPL